MEQGIVEAVSVTEQTLTEEQKAQARANIGVTNSGSQLAPLFANTIEECTDPSKVYVLPDGYLYAYMAIKTYPYENMIPLSSNADGTPYVGENGEDGYKNNYRLNSSGAETAQDGVAVTGFIPAKNGDTIYFKNIPYMPNSAADVCYDYFAVYNKDFSLVTSIRANGDIDGLDYLFTYTVDAETGILASITLNDEYGSYDYGYIRISAAGLDSSSIVAVNEEISGSEKVVYGWANTGHAFVPADYEDRIIELEKDVENHTAELEIQKKKIESLSAGGTVVPGYVVSEAESAMKKVDSAQGGRTFTFAAISDLHYGVWNYTDGILHACQALKHISERIELDAVAVLGDYTDGSPDTGYDNAIADFEAVNSMLDDLRLVPNFRLAGNHDIYTENPALSMRYINAYSDDVVWGSRTGGYFYRDFDGYKVRVIGVNTSETKAGLDVTTEQYNWFVSALDLSDKADISEWSILVLSHHPLDWYPTDSAYRFCYILDAYKNGTSGEADGIAYDFTNGKNAAKLIGNIHGHIHNFKVDYIHIGNVNSENKTSVLRIATPNACYNRENEYEGAWAENVAYGKTLNSAKDTSFCIYCIDLDEGTIKAICYGAGYDREISYQYENNVPPITKESFIDLTDRVTGKKYTLYVENGKLTMAEREE